VPRAIRIRKPGADTDQERRRDEESLSVPVALRERQQRDGAAFAICDRDVGLHQPRHAEVYALTAFLLFKNGVIKEDEVMDAQSLPKVVMPNLKGFSMPPEPWKHGAPRLQHYP
jgi:hypothetical protein